MTSNSPVTLPNFVILGQGRSETKPIYRALKSNPAIGLPDRKELNFFCTHFGKGVDWYARHFRHLKPDTQIIGEVSPSYLNADTLQRIADTLGPQTKIVLILRRPLERAYSQYLQDICADQRPGSFGLADRTLPDQLDALQNTIRTAYDLFGPMNVLPLFFELDIACQDPTFEPQILHFLGLPGAKAGKPPKKGVSVTAGNLPRYIFSGEQELPVWMDTRQFIIPPRHLVFCGDQRSGWVKANPTTDDVTDAFFRQSTWTPAISRKDYKLAQERVILPAVNALEKEFAFDLSHWDCAPRPIAPECAPPPRSLLKQLAPDAKTTD